MKGRHLHKLLLSLALVVLALPATAQTTTYGNEWIDYSKTYYKFRVGKNGVCRIYRSALSAAGLPSSVQGSNFMLFRDGQEVPIWVSAENMSGSDYIEFWGKKADGSLDKKLYLSPEQQANDRMSLFSDTAAYFLTYDNNSNHLRFVQSANAIPGSTPAPAAYCLATVSYSPPRTQWTPGPSYAGATADLWSPEFDAGEGFIDGWRSVPHNQQAATTLQTPNLVAGVAGRVRAAVITRSFAYNHNVSLSVNGTSVASVSFGATEARYFDEPISAGVLSGGSGNQVTFSATAAGSAPGDYDYMGLALAELEYPRNFDFTGVDAGIYKLPATGSWQYVEVAGMNSGRLYDITSRKWYAGNTAVSGKTRFYLEPSTSTREFVLLADGASSITSLQPAKSIQFTDWGQTSRQGDFIIITHADMLAPVGGRRYVEEYANYRASTVGGNHKVVVADVAELYDQFAYGQDIHPLSIRHFLQYAYERWTNKPADVFLIGRGIYYSDYQKFLSNRAAYNFPLVPTYGVPGSDLNFVMFRGVHKPRLRIGRLTVWAAPEIGVYLNKIQNAEQLFATAAAPTLASELWKKRAMHIVGANSKFVQTLIEPEMQKAALIIQDSLTGKSVTHIAKTENVAVSQINAKLVDSLLRGGISQFTFYGHGSPWAFDFQLPDVSTYSSNYRAGCFLGLGCDLSQMFDLANKKTITEQYVLAPSSGAAAFIASANTSFTGFNDYYLFAYYTSMSRTNYGAPIGTHVNFTYDSVTNKLIGQQAYPNFASAQLESVILSGDPSIKFPAPAKPDYHVTADAISSIPANVTTSLDTFRLRIGAFNLGKAIADSVTIKVEHINPAGAVALVGTYTIANLHFSDTSDVKVPIDKTKDLGLNKYKVTIDAPGRYDELSELNNVASFDLFIYSDNLVPVYPQEFAILGQPDVTLKASTMNPFRALGRYRLEIDTTELFNSPLKQTTTVDAKGGVVSWKPQIPYYDSVVYYWRTAFDSAIGGGLQWTNSSFLYLAGSPDGWNQSHYYQYGRSNSAGLFLRPDRKFYYGPINHTLWVLNTMLCNGGPDPASCNKTAPEMRTWFDGTRIEQSSHSSVWNAISILVIDSATGRIWRNTPSTTYGSTPPQANGTGSWSRQFDISNQAGRVAAARFIDTIPDGSYVMIKNAYWRYNSQPFYFINTWKSDTTVTGPGRSLYDGFKKLGFSKIDSFYRERVFIFMCRKNDPTLPVYQAVTDSFHDKLEVTFNIKGSDKAGEYISTVVGPAREWKSLNWKSFATDTLAKNDTTSVSVVGIDIAGNETPIYSNVKGDTSLADISAAQYPRLKLIWKSKDSINLTSPQLAYWRVLFQPVPEAALNPSSHFVFSDSLSQGQMQTFSTSIENLTPYDMDSLLVRYRVIAADGVTRTLADQRYKPLKGNDTLHATFTFDPAAYPGQNLFFIEANPANDQPEQYHPNNLGYLPFKIGVDTRHPLLDVTFDGVHILNGDLVSARPLIKVRLKDENKYMALDDTALVRVALRYPSDSITNLSHPIPFDGTICRFVPATKTEPVNEAYIEFRPDLVEDGSYQLTVSAADKSGNAAGGVAGSSAPSSAYKIAFEVDNKPSITNVLNYPNPFSTATAFAFTLTGSQIPSQLKIQIMTVTGKVVREITRNELGPLHIGRNLTEYKWDGRDQYGQLLGNGVYLYRVVTTLNGQDVDLRADSREMTRRGGGIDKYFKNGWGKMYIMR